MNRLNSPGLPSPRFERSLQSSTLPDFDSAIRLDSAFQSSRVPRHVVVREWDAAPRGTRRHCTPFSTCTFSQCGCALERSRTAAQTTNYVLAFAYLIRGYNVLEETVLVLSYVTMPPPARFVAFRFSRCVSFSVCSSPFERTLRFSCMTFQADRAR